jgi:hypothetical protein
MILEVLTDGVTPFIKGADMNETIRIRCHHIANEADRLGKLLSNGRSNLPDLDAAELLVGLDRLEQKLGKLTQAAEAAFKNGK